MSELKVGGFKANESSSQEYDFDATPKTENVIDASEQDVIDTTTNTPEQVAESVVDEVSEQSNVQSAEVTRDENIDKKGSDVELQPTNTSQEVQLKESKVEIDDESTLKYLSEKLGREIQSFDDLKTQQENPLDKDPYLKNLQEWREKTGRPIEDWIKYQKNYDEVTDLDVAREFLQHEYPNFTKEEIDAELKSFQPTEDDYEDEISLKNRNLKKYATKGRGVLKQMVSELGDVSTYYPKEVQGDLQLAKQVKEQQALNQKFQQEYDNGIKKASLSTESYKINLDDDLAIDFKLSENERKALPEKINTMAHWKNEDGSWNHKAVINDAIKIEYFDKMVKLAYEQGLSSGKDALIKEAKNTTLGEPSPNSANSQNSSKAPIIEDGIDSFLGSNGMKIRFKK